MRDISVESLFELQSALYLVQRIVVKRFPVHFGFRCKFNFGRNNKDVFEVILQINGGMSRQRVVVVRAEIRDSTNDIPPGMQNFMDQRVRLKMPTWIGDVDVGVSINHVAVNCCEAS